MRAISSASLAFAATIALLAIHQASGAAIEFVPPAQGGGDIHWEGRGALLAVSRSDEATFAFGIEMGQAWELREYLAVDDVQGPMMGLGDYQVPTTSTTSSAESSLAVSGSPDGQGVHALLMREGAFTLDAADADLWLQPETRCLDELMVSEDQSVHPFDHPMCRDKGSVLVRIMAQGMLTASAINATGATWTGWISECAGARPCPTGANREAVAATPWGTRASTLRYEELSGTASSATYQAHGGVVYALLDRADLEAAGWLRLPLADGDACACAVPENQTIWATGDLALAGLRPGTGGSTLQADLGGHVESARFDETPVAGALLSTRGWAITGTMAAAGGFGLVLLLKLVLIPALTRLGKDEVLHHPSRRNLFQVIVRNPGIGFRRLVQATGLPTGTARHHLNMLERSEVVVEKPLGSTVRFYENHGAYDATWRQVAALRAPGLRELHSWLATHPDCPQKEILESWAGKGWRRSSTQHRLQRLVTVGAATTFDRGRWKHYRAVAVPEGREPAPPSDDASSGTVPGSVPRTNPFKTGATS